MRNEGLFANKPLGWRRQARRSRDSGNYPRMCPWLQTRDKRLPAWIAVIGGSTIRSEAQADYLGDWFPARLYCYTQ